MAVAIQSHKHRDALPANPAQHRARLHDLVKRARTVMLLSQNEDGAVHGRPMRLVRIEANETMYFATSIESAMGLRF